MRMILAGVLAACATVLFAGAVSASTPGGDVRLSHDANDPGYVSSYTLATGTPYTDATLAECSQSRGRQNEPAVAVDPRDTDVILGSSNDYCGVYNRARGSRRDRANLARLLPLRERGRVLPELARPGLPGRHLAVRCHREAASPHGELRRSRHCLGRARPAFFGSESSDDPAGTPKTFGDVWVATFDNAGGTTGDPDNDGKRYRQTVVVERGSSAPNLLGKFNDKTSIEADHNSRGRCDNNVYFSWSRFSGNAGGVGIYFSRSTNHGVTFSNPMKVSQTLSDVQFPDIAITSNDNVYVAFRSFASGRGPEGDSIYYVKSTDCGATFSRPILLQNFIRNDAIDVSEPEPVPAQSTKDDPGFEEESPEEGSSRDCGDFNDHCESGFTFFRRDTQPRATADQFDTANPNRFYIVYDATKPGTQVPTSSTYGTNGSGTAGQAAIFFLRVNGATGAKTGPR